MSAARPVLAGNEAPPFWFDPPGLQARLLGPAAYVYGSVARRRMNRRAPPAVNAPVICVGNLTTGGSGKTPTAIALAHAAKRHGHRPGIVLRGYGGHHTAPYRVDAAKDTARSVGDEALLLARAADTVVGSDRARSAQMLIDGGADLIIMDDGFQSRSLAMDYALIVLDSRRGIGNGHVIPAGPLRAPLRDQMRLADAILRVGSGEAADGVVRAAARAGKPVMGAVLQPAPVPALKATPLLAFCGIGHPDKFFDTLHGAGYDIKATRAFGDHHLFSESDARSLMALAEADGLALVTTEKDAVRLSHRQGPLADLRERVHVQPVSLVFDNATDEDTIMDAVKRAYHARRIGSR